MGNNLFTYVQQLEMLAFFSGYPLIYCLVGFLNRNASFKNRWGERSFRVLPFAYALIGTLYLSLQLINFFPDYTMGSIMHRIQQPYLFIWGLLTILFWVPVISKRQIFSLLHSLVFFFIIIKDLFLQLTGVPGHQDIIKNEMNVYTASIFLNLAAFIILVLLSSLRHIPRKYLKP
jgi:hypothetical protein